MPLDPLAKEQTSAVQSAGLIILTVPVSRPVMTTANYCWVMLRPHGGWLQDPRKSQKKPGGEESFASPGDVRCVWANSDCSGMFMSISRRKRKSVLPIMQEDLGVIDNLRRPKLDSNFIDAPSTSRTYIHQNILTRTWVNYLIQRCSLCSYSRKVLSAPYLLFEPRPELLPQYRIIAARGTHSRPLGKIFAVEVFNIGGCSSIKWGDGTHRGRVEG